jgi:tetratricopeptide (TPR) repeat protein
MTGTKPDSKGAGAPGKTIRWVENAIFGLACALVIGAFAWSAEPGFLELTSPQAEDAYYNLLVQGFRAGQLNVKREPAPALAQLANPYDPAANAPYAWDKSRLCYEMSYYGGKLYLYFGITPAVTLFWPYVTLTGHYLSHRSAVVIFLALGFLTEAGLLYGLWRRYFPETSIWAVTAGVLALGLGTGILEMLAACDVYEVARSCGFAFAMLSLAAIWRALHEPERQVKWLALASLAYGLAVGARPSLLFGAIMLLVPVVRSWSAAVEPGSRPQTAWLLAAVVVPLTGIGLGLMLYNYRRFDNPLEFGWHYQLNECRNISTRLFSPGGLWFNFRFYFLEPIQWTAHFPFLEGRPASPSPAGYLGWTSYGGVGSNYPVTWLALAAPLAWKSRPLKEAATLRWFAIAVFFLSAVCAVTLCFISAASSDYELDFLPAGMLLAVMGIWGLERVLAHVPVWRRAARWGSGLLLAYTLLFNALASVQAHATANYLAGNLLLNQGDVDQAIKHFQRASLLEPRSAGWHFGLANALSRARRVNEAIAEYQKALERQPDFPEADNNLAYTLLQVGRPDEAIRYFQKALEFQQSYQAYYNLGYAYRQNQMGADAVVNYQKALQLQPHFIPAQRDLAWMLATWPEASVRKGNQAVVLAGEADRLSGGQDPQILRTLAAAYAEAGRFPEAVVTAKRALTLAPTQSNPLLIHELQTETGFYQSNSPCRSTSGP